MDFDTHMQAVREVAVYPAANTGKPEELAYIALGLVGESGEVMDIFDEPITQKTDINKYLMKVAEELGDTHWYIVRMADVLKLSRKQLEETAQSIADDPDDYRMNHVVGMSMIDVAQCMQNAACRVADACKKIYRGRESPEFNSKSEKYYKKVIENLAVMYIYWECTALRGGFSIGEDILQPNIDKLIARKERGELQIR